MGQATLHGVPAQRQLLAALRPLARGAARLCLPAGVAVGIQLVDPPRMLALKRRYLGVAAVTDVLSFPEDDPGYAGDLALCVEVATEQAAAAGHDLVTELLVLTVHGMVHLCGFDHERSRLEARRQAELEMGVLSSLGVPPQAALAGRGMQLELWQSKRH